jgi:hypothetical protein
LGASCLDNPDCFQLNNNILGVSFKVIGSGAADTLTITRINASSGSGLTLTDTTKKTGSNNLSLPLNNFVDTTAFTFYTTRGQKFLSVGYQVKTQFVSEDCGSKFVLSDLKVVRHNFDSVRVVSSSPATASGGSNVEIYRCPVTNFFGITHYQLTYSSNKKASVVSTKPYENIQAVNTSGGILQSSSTGTTLLPVDLKNDSTNYVFRVDSEVAKHLKVTYTKTSEVRYRACGEQTYITNLKIKSTDFDSISFAQDANGNAVTSLSDPAKISLRVFDCPDLKQMQVVFRKRVNATTLADTVAVVKRARADFMTEDLIPVDTTAASAMILPLNPSATQVTYQVELKGGKVISFTLTYSVNNTFFKKACSDIPLIFGLAKQGDNANVNVVQNGTIIQYPPVTNLEIIVN